MVLSIPMAFAEKSLGTHSQGEVRDACNAGGGELLGVSDLGSYGCEFADQDVLILCNKNQECTAYKAGARGGISGVSPSSSRQSLQRCKPALSLTPGWRVVAIALSKPYYATRITSQ